MSPSVPMRSLADDIRSRSTEEIADILRARPDLAHPWPSDLSQLARRAADDSSVLEAMQSLNTTELRVLEVYAALHEADSEEVAAGLPESPEEVRRAVERLWSMGLLWCRTRPRIVRAAQQAFGAFPCGLLAAGHSKPDPEQVRAAAMDVDSDELSDLVWATPVRDQPSDLLTTHAGGYALSRESALILRDGAFLPAGPPRPDHPAADPAPAELLWAPISGVRYLVTDLRDRPLPWHPSRGVTRRAITDRAQQMAVPPEDLMVWVELAVSAELIGPLDDALYPTAAAEVWLQESPAQMWLSLVVAWIDTDRLLPLCRPEELGCATGAITPRASTHRRNVLQVWPRGARLDAQGLADEVAWYRPRMLAASQQAPEVFGEAQLLGLAQAGMSTAALDLLPESLQEAAETLPPPQELPCLIVQPDQTIIAPANIDTDTWRLLHDVAVVESWGPVTMHRIDQGRLRAAVTGRDAEQTLERLRSASRTGLPQSLEYLVADAARSSMANIYPATVVEVTEADVATVSELGLHQVGPQTFTSDLPQDVLRRRLADAGVVASESDRPTLAESMERQRIEHLDERTLQRLVGHLVRSEAGDQTEPPPLTPADPRTIADMCQQVIDRGGRMWLQYAEGSSTAVELMEPLQLRSGQLTAWSVTGGRTLTVPLSRIAAFGDQP